LVDDIEPPKMAARFIKKARQQAGLSQSALARQVRTSQNQIWHLEQGTMKRGPSVDLLFRIARACNRELELTLK